MKLPKKSKLFKNIVRNKDNRGSIKSIVDYKISNVSIITSNSNSIRSNHYHIKDFHFMYVLEGKIDYFFKGIDDDNDNMSYLEVNIGDTIFTPKMEIHCTFFPIKTKLIVSSYYPRDQKTYEEDTVRVDFIDKINISCYLKKYGK
ncbi:MAG: hypothetical protein CBB97_07900 [Candidatus Endolissoclinum sp. TMED37]|nr:MAG: hypothetical protein CBB97_07900 [Candidatus Endolissoclinum sp. TMED37]|tara:strand:+ start:2611 stop:3045 length:435 start_codon:yes stop_codon:yes gene_type:complete